jgi:hypothetical protein
VLDHARLELKAHFAHKHDVGGVEGSGPLQPVQPNGVIRSTPKHSYSAGQVAVAVVAFSLLQDVTFEHVFDLQGNTERGSLRPQVLHDPVGPVGLTLDKSTRLAHGAVP